MRACLYFYYRQIACQPRISVFLNTYYLDLRITLRQVTRAKIFSWILFHPGHSRLSFYRECLHSLHFNVTTNLDVKSEIESTNIDRNFCVDVNTYLGLWWVRSGEISITITDACKMFHLTSLELIFPYSKTLLKNLYFLNMK